jgi:hypothetical protein
MYDAHLIIERLARLIFDLVTTDLRRNSLPRTNDVPSPLRRNFEFSFVPYWDFVSSHCHHPNKILITRHLAFQALASLPECTVYEKGYLTFHQTFPIWTYLITARFSTRSFTTIDPFPYKQYKCDWCTVHPINMDKLSITVLSLLLTVVIVTEFVKFWFEINSPLCDKVVLKRQLVTNIMLLCLHPVLRIIWRNTCQYNLLWLLFWHAESSLSEFGGYIYEGKYALENFLRTDS